MNSFLSRRIQVLIAVLVSLCFVEIAWSTFDGASNFKTYYKNDEFSRVMALFKPFQRHIPYYDKFNFSDHQGGQIHIQRYAQFALAPRPFRRGQAEQWLIFYNPKNLPIPDEISKAYDLILAAPGGASLYRRKE